MPVILCSLLMRYETADLNDRTIAPNDPGLTLILCGLGGSRPHITTVTKYAPVPLRPIGHLPQIRQQKTSKSIEFPQDFKACQMSNLSFTRHLNTKIGTSPPTQSREQNICIGLLMDFKELKCFCLPAHIRHLLSPSPGD